MQISVGMMHTLAPRSDDVLMACGSNQFGQCNVPPGEKFVEAIAGGYHSLARTTDGRIVGWQRNIYRQLNVPLLPPGLTYAQIDGGEEHNVALASDGSVVTWGTTTAASATSRRCPLG